MASLSINASPQSHAASPQSHAASPQSHAASPTAVGDLIKRHKLLLIGETGSGKSSFIEFLLNWAKQYVGDFELHKVTSFLPQPNHQKENWVSDTTESAIYPAVFNDFHMDIIDTPGFADNRGEQQRKENIADIISKVQEVGYVNCICFVINGTNSRLSEVTRLVISEISLILPPVALQNMCVLFTNAKDKYSLNFDVKLLKQFKLKVLEDSTFIIDNPYSRWVKAKGENPNDKTRKRMITDFEDAKEEMEELLKKVKKLQPVPTIKFGEFYEVIQDIEMSVSMLITQHDNLNKMKEKIKELKQYVETAESIIQDIDTTYEKVELTPSENTNVICGAYQCYSNCHLDCYCSFRLLSIRFCKNLSIFGCKQCPHTAANHRSVRYYFKKVMEKIPLPSNVNACIDTTKDLMAIQKPLIEASEGIIAPIIDQLKRKINKMRYVELTDASLPIAKEKMGTLMGQVSVIPGLENKEILVELFKSTIASL